MPEKTQLTTATHAALGSAGGVMPVDQGEVNVTIGQSVQPRADALRHNAAADSTSSKKVRRPRRCRIVLCCLGFLIVAAVAAILVVGSSGDDSPDGASLVAAPPPPGPPPLPAGQVEKHKVVVRFTAAGGTAHRTAHTHSAYTPLCGVPLRALRL